jgi:hypothetical protein
MGFKEWLNEDAFLLGGKVDRDDMSADEVKVVSSIDDEYAKFGQRFLTGRKDKKSNKRYVSESSGEITKLTPVKRLHIVVVVGVVAIASAIAGIIYWWKKKKKREEAL